MIIPVFPHNLKQDRAYKRNNKFDCVSIITHATNSCITNKCITGTNKNDFCAHKEVIFNTNLLPSLSSLTQPRRMRRKSTEVCSLKNIVLQINNYHCSLLFKYPPNKTGLKI